MGQPERVAQLERLVEPVACLRLRDGCLEVADQRTAIVSGGGSGPSGSAAAEESRTEAGRNGRRAPLDLVGHDIQVPAPDTDEPDVEDEVGSARPASCSTRAGWLASVAASISSRANRVRPTLRSSTAT